MEAADGGPKSARFESCLKHHPPAPNTEQWANVCLAKSARFLNRYIDSLGELMRRLLCLVVLLGSVAVIAQPAGSQPIIPHIMIVLMENHGAGSIIGNQRPFENARAAHYITLNNWTAVDHPSAPNYVALTTGQDNHKAGKNDCTPTYPKVKGCDYEGDNLGVQLASAGIPAAWFDEDLKGNGCSIANSESGKGDVNHEPWAYLPTWQSDPTACAEAGLTTKSRMING